ncbi:MAG: histidinol-phosphate aminotransferase family protein [Chitinophagaceae bacterium]|nr:histidinol-phosphate aminotransferase family protein [Chitinophagaceae bacterium]
MVTNRRNWLKQMGLGMAGLGIGKFETIAAPAGNFPADDEPIRLVANENPYGPSPLAKKAMADHISLSNRYTRNLTDTLRAALAKKNNVSADNILTSAGSTEVLDIAARIAALKKGSTVSPSPSFNYWTGIAEKFGVERIVVPLTTGKKINLPAVLSAIKSDTCIVYICNPNNPTGTLCARKELVDFVTEASKKAIVLVDEAYIDFTEEKSLCDLVHENKNLVIAKTFSKIYGLAGARAGYAIAHPETIELFAGLQPWPNGSISVVSAAAAIASLQDKQFVKSVYTRIQHSRKYTMEQMERMGIPCIPSYTNFVYFSLEHYKKDYTRQLALNHITGTGIWEEQGKWSRITIGTQHEMEKYIRAIS